MQQFPVKVEQGSQGGNIFSRVFDELTAFCRSRSLFILHYCTGCGAIELPPAMTSRFDMERLGISPMVSPRQADILLITGYVSVKTLKRAIRSYEQMQNPKYVMGLGDPEGVLDAVARGADLFDCVWPTRLARHGKVLTSDGDYNLKRAEFTRDPRPLAEDCWCHTCSTVSRAGSTLTMTTRVSSPSGKPSSSPTRRACSRSAARRPW